MARRLCHLWLAALCLLLAGRWAWGSPSGLNNIPTTDVPPEKVLVLQSWTNLANNEHPQTFLGLKFSALEGLEMGFDWKANDVSHAHATFQTKYAFDLAKDVWKVAVGIANLSEHRKHTGDPFGYAVTSLDVKAVRLYLGFTPQRDNEGFFIGIDRTVPFLGRDLQLKADALQINRMSDILYSGGFLYNLRRRDDDGESQRPGLLGVWDMLTRNVVLESWATVPPSGSTAFTLKLNYVIEF